jgi:hypothetical protein
MEGVMNKRNWLVVSIVAAASAAFAGAVPPPPPPDGGGGEISICDVDPNACNPDIDGDGVPNEQDACPNTAPGAVVDAEGCSVADLNPCDAGWKNHGAYVRSFVQTAQAFVDAALLSQDAMDDLVSQAAESSCGK